MKVILYIEFFISLTKQAKFDQLLEDGCKCEQSAVEDYIFRSCKIGVVLLIVGLSVTTVPL